MLIYSHQVTETGTVSTEPVTLTYAKLHLRVDITTDDDLITNLIVAAREYAEIFCARSFVQHTYRADLANFADLMELPLGPVQSVTSIKYYDTASPSVLQTLASSVYALNKDCITRTYGQTWPSIGWRNSSDAVQITYTTGYSDLSSPEDTVANTPQACIAAMLLLIGDLHENKEAEVLYPGMLLENRAFRMLLNTYRQYR